MNKRIVYIAGWMIVLVLSSCSPRALREARETVVRADSMRAAGQMYEDSSCLAQAYKTLGAIPFPFREGLGVGSAYAHACYHYGRLLRAKENPVAAMQCFIDATHSRTHDYPILGRVYSNMGSIAHLAGEYDLSYTMYSHSSEMFLRANDTTAYYYALNDMAFELAEQGKREETLAIISTIENKCNDCDILIKTIESKIELYLKCEQYDSTIYYANMLTSDVYYAPTGMLIKAQAFSYLSIKDSALYYARKTMDITKSINEQYNALYILSHDDSTLSEKEILELTSLRDDIHTYELDVRKSEHAKAIQLWRNNEGRTKHIYVKYLIWFILMFLLGVTSAVLIYVINRRHRLLQKVSADVTEQNHMMMEQFEQNCQALRSIDAIKEKLIWNDYKRMCVVVDSNFSFIIGKLQSKQELNEKEIRLCILVLIDGFTSKQMAELLFYAESGIRNFKSNTAKKIGTNGKEMHQFLVKMAYG